MDKRKVYRKTGRAFLSVWVIVWVVLICKSSLPYPGYNDLMLNIFEATILNLAFNPCAFIGAILLDLVALKDHPERKRGWAWLVILYLIIWVGLFIFFILPGFSLDKPLIVETQAIEKPIAK